MVHAGHTTLKDDGMTKRYAGRIGIIAGAVRLLCPKNETRSMMCNEKGELEAEISALGVINVFGVPTD